MEFNINQAFSTHISWQFSQTRFWFILVCRYVLYQNGSFSHFIYYFTHIFIYLCFIWATIYLEIGFRVTRRLSLSLVLLELSSDPRSQYPYELAHSAEMRRIQNTTRIPERNWTNPSNPVPHAPINSLSLRLGRIFYLLKRKAKERPFAFCLWFL
jgi:hypothetical protein